MLTDFRPAFDPAPSIGEVLIAQIGRVVHLAWLHAGVAAVLIAVLLLARPVGGRWPGLLLLALLAGAAVRFLLYPLRSIRFYTPHLFGIGLIILHALRPRDARRLTLSGAACAC